MKKLFKRYIDFLTEETNPKDEDGVELVSELAYRKMKLTRIKIYTLYPFFAKFASNLKLYENKHLTHKSMGTDGLTIHYDPDFVLDLPLDQLLAVYIHEILHVAFLHFSRQGPRDHDDWNRATDYAINSIIKEMNLKLPSDTLYKSEFRGQSAESIFDKIGGKKGGGSKHVLPPGSCPGCGNPSPGKGKGKCKCKGGNCSCSGTSKGSKGTCPICGGPAKPGKGGKVGSNVGGVYKPGELNGGVSIDDAIDDPKTGTPKQVEERIKKIAVGEMSKARGIGSLTLDQLLNLLYMLPQVDWKKELKKFFNTISDDPTYKMSNRRLVHSGTYIPGPKRSAGGLKNLIILMDTSGSVSDDAIKNFFNEINSIGKTIHIKDVYVVTYDDKVDENRDVKFYKDLKSVKPAITKRGGTNFVNGFKWINNFFIQRKRKTVAGVIFFTDGEAPFPTTSMVPYHKKVYWVIVDDPSARVVPPFGKTLRIQSDWLQKQ